MERVQFQQEQMLVELKDLVHKGLFTQKEVKQIMQKRTAFETALVRRVPKKADFLRYAAYEMDLEALRHKRAARLNAGPAPPSVSDYALVRRQFHIFERALKRFKGDVALWIQYIQVAKKEGARALMGRITARALQLHPNVPALYVLAAEHELRHLSPSAARTLLQRGIRLNAESIEMWREYVKMELGFVESLRRRWAVLGIAVKESKYGYAEDEAAQKEILEGAIVKSVISSAVRGAFDKMTLQSLHELIMTYPCPRPLRDALLDHLFNLLHTTLDSDPAAVKLSATRFLIPGMEGEDLIEALKHANEQLMAAVRPSSAEDAGLAAVYANFITEWCNKDIDDHLKGYLMTSLHMLAQRADAPPALLSSHLTLLTAHPGVHAHLPSQCGTPAQIVRLARKYTTRAPTSSTVWVARLGAERQFADQAAVDRTWTEARNSVDGEGADAVQLQLLETLLHESRRIRDPAIWRSVHESLLMSYAAEGARAQQECLNIATSGAMAVSDARVRQLRHMAINYLPSARVWAGVFELETEAGAIRHQPSDGEHTHRVLEVVYEYWREQDP
ncbi:U3 small nucleolar RNA-associated protein 6-domain-containing protein [Amylocystis lapponica]|nr:U3 small nucleolar RNA-associated protein 6-domain-containing protein [Amylocystis lapponica]